MGICKSKITSGSSENTIITKKTSKNQNDIITKSNSNQKIHLCIKNKKTNYENCEEYINCNEYDIIENFHNIEQFDNIEEFDNIEDCHSYLFEMYTSGNFKETVCLVAFNNKILVSENVVLLGDHLGFVCFITKMKLNVDYEENNKNFEIDGNEIICKKQPQFTITENLRGKARLGQYNHFKYFKNEQLLVKDMYGRSLYYYLVFSRNNDAIDWLLQKNICPPPEVLFIAENRKSDIKKKQQMFLQ